MTRDVIFGGGGQRPPSGFRPDPTKRSSPQIVQGFAPLENAEMTFLKMTSFVRISNIFLMNHDMKAISAIHHHHQYHRYRRHHHHRRRRCLRHHYHYHDNVIVVDFVFVVITVVATVIVIDLVIIICN